MRMCNRWRGARCTGNSSLVTLKGCVWGRLVFVLVWNVVSRLLDCLPLVGFADACLPPVAKMPRSAWARSAVPPPSLLELVIFAVTSLDTARTAAAPSPRRPTGGGSFSTGEKKSFWPSSWSVSVTVAATLHGGVVDAGSTNEGLVTAWALATGLPIPRITPPRG